MLKSAEVVLLAVPPPLFRGEARDVVQDERFVIVYNYCENDKVQRKIAICWGVVYIWYVGASI